MCVFECAFYNGETCTHYSVSPFFIFSVFVSFGLLFYVHLVYVCVCVCEREREREKEREKDRKTGRGNQTIKQNSVREATTMREVAVFCDTGLISGLLS